MKGNHSRSSGKRKDENTRAPSRRSRRNGGSPAAVVLWIFLGVMMALAVAAVILLLPKKEAPEAPRPTYDPGPAGSAFVPGETAPALTTEEGQGGRTVVISGIDCEYTPPTEITFGVLRSVDLTALAQTVIENAAAAGWGELDYTVSENGGLVLRAVNAPVLAGSDYPKQEAFLASAQPENLARTFLDNSGLIPLLREYGLTLSTAAENDGGQIVFHGTGAGPQAECSVRFSFLYTGAFNQAALRAVYLAGPAVTDQVAAPEAAASRAVTWSAGTAETVRATGLELRHIRGIPFYAFTCDDGTVAYALAVKESVLTESPGAAETYRELLSGGIREYVATSGGE